jgi:hypothetical protein
MRKRNLLMCAAFLLASWSGAVIANEGGATVEGLAAFGTSLTTPTDHTNRVGEYVNQSDLDEFVANMYMDLFGSTQSSLYNVHFLYQDSVTKNFDFGVKTDRYVSADVGFQSFMHNLDHDNLQNMQGKAGGKQVYHTDNDPLGKYFLEYSEFNAEIKVDIPFLENGQLYGSYRDQHKKGFVQEMTIDHCAFCHVESNAKRIDQQTETWKAGIEGTQGIVSFNYEITETTYREGGNANERDWFSARHPGTGLPLDFASRLNFSDVTMPYARSTSNDKTSHNVTVKMDVPQVAVLKAAYTNTNRRSWWTGMENQFDAYAVGGSRKWNRNHRSNVKFLAYETKVDDWMVNLNNYRAGDLVAGNLDFDWTRISAANRQVIQFDLNHSWRIGKGKHLKGSLRHQTTDRDAMAQSQTSYLFDGVNDGNAGATLVPSEAYENKTSVLRLKGRYDQRLGKKGNFNAGVTGTFVDKPFMNPTAMCEESLEGVNSAHVTAGAVGRLYYFQRERYGSGTNQPTQSLRFNGKASYQLTPRVSVNGFLTYTTEKNDDLNVYEFDRDILAPGFNLWTAPSDKVLFTLGWTYNKFKSNANLCIPVFDG